MIKRQTLTITKAFSKKAIVYGTPAYKELAEAKRDNPNFKIIVKANTKVSTPLSKNIGLLHQNPALMQ